MGVKDILMTSLGYAHTMLGVGLIITPIYTLQIGYIPAVLICTFLAAINYYTSVLLIRHKGNCFDI